jgi:hypothetical protein
MVIIWSAAAANRPFITMANKNLMISSFINIIIVYIEYVHVLVHYINFLLTFYF